MNSTYVVIMAGGIGSRFWPESRSSYPKQFLDILNMGRSLLQMTFDRFSAICDKDKILIITNEQYASFVKEQLPDISDDQILKEPMRRNTAPCIAYAAYKIFEKDPNANLIVSPADHIVLKEDAFIEAINKGLNFVNGNDVLLTLGIKPSRPDTGYGYIQYDDTVEGSDAFPVKTFTEKPTLDLAETFLSSGDFVWNSGMFLWSVTSIIRALKYHLPEIADVFQSGEGIYYTNKEEKFIKNTYSLCTNISIDYGVMEKSDNVYVIPAEFGWSDVGTWGSLYDIYDKDYLGNAVNGKNVKIYNSSNNMIVAPKDKLVVVQGLDEFCVIDSGDVLLICEKKEEQEIKKITNDLKIGKLDKYL